MLTFSVDTFVCPQMHLDTWLIPFNRSYNKKTSLRQPSSVKERLVETLRYSAPCNSLKLLSWSYRIGKATISKIIKEASNAMWEVLYHVYLKPPQESYQTISDEFGVFHTVLEQLMENMLPSNVPNYLGHNTLITKD